MKKKLLLSIIFLINAVGIAGVEKLNDFTTDTLNDQNGNSKTDVISDNASLAAELSGTCYKGLCCSSPSCSRWSDIDQNGICDRGF